MSTPKPAMTRPSGQEHRNVNNEDDVCVEWDESGNADLRKVASPSFATPRSEDGTPRRTSRSSSSVSHQRTALSASALKKRAARSDQEISIMWKTLEKDANSTTMPINETTETPLRANLAVPANEAVQENPWGLVKSRRRRGGGGAGDKTKPGIMAHAMSLHAQGSVVVDANKHNAKRRLSADDAFADLLERLKTPDRNDAMPPPSKSRRSLSSLPSKALVHHSARTVVQPGGKDESPDPFGPFPDVDFEALDKSILANSQNSFSQKLEGTLDTTTRVSELMNPTTQKATGFRSLPNSNTLHNPEHAASNTAKNLQADDKDPKHMESSPLVQPITSNVDRSKSTQPNTDQPGSPDPFGDLPDIDVAMMEQKISEATQNIRNAKPDATDDRDPFGAFPKVDITVIDQKIKEANQSKIIASIVATESDDPFGTFPEIDFDAIDLQIDAAKGKASEADMGLSRYRIVGVSDDVSTFTRILHVAKWRDEMYSEIEDSLAIHHERSGSYPVPKTWAVDGEILLRGEWYYTEAEKGDFIHIYSLFGRTSTNCLPLTLDSRADPNCDDLLLIMHPEILLVPTTISETTKCMRRAVLKNRFGSSGSNKALLLGTLRHRFFEESLQTVDFSPQAVRDRIDRLVRESSQDIAGCPGLKSNDVETELCKFVPQVKRFVDDYTSIANPGKLHLVSVDNVEGLRPVYFRATGVHAIEETISSPEMGIKGNVDAVLQARVSETPMETPRQVLVGVELKTGHRQSNDKSHMAQLALYNVMLRDRPEDSTDTVPASQNAILLYLNEKKVKVSHIAPSASQLKSLIGQRNDVAIKQKQAAELRGIEVTFEKESAWPSVKMLDPLPVKLPPVESSGMCEHCYMARECSLYTSLEKQGGVKSPEGGAYAILLDKFTGNLSEKELEYFGTWDRLLDLEASAMVRPVAVKWLKPSSELETSDGKTVSSLVIKKIGTPQKGKEMSVLATFVRAQDASNQNKLSSLSISVGSHTILSADDVTVGTKEKRRNPRMHIARGIVREVMDDSVVLNISESAAKTLSRISDNAAAGTTPKFRLDRDEVATGLGTLRRNITNLLTLDKVAGDAESPMLRRLPKLRELILQRREPRYTVGAEELKFSPPRLDNVPNIPCLDPMEMLMEYSEMNEDQKNAVDQVLKAQDYTLIQGMPGTGKTFTISLIVRILVAHGKRVLITSYTHSAVDNVLLKLTKVGLDAEQSDYTRPIIRIGDSTRCHTDTQHLLVENMARNVVSQGSQEDHYASPESVRHCIKRARVVGVTALTVPTSSLLAGEHFDVVIVDEAGQISQPAIIGALMAADTFILVGDHMQLPPLVNSELAEKGGFGVSLLRMLAEAHPNHVAQLTYQYRMAEDICQLTNDITYKGKLKCGSDFVKFRRLKLKGYPGNVSQCVYRKAIDPNKTVVFLDTDQQKHGSNEILSLETTGETNLGSVVNKTEATIVARIVESLISCNVAPDSIGIICPFNAQVKLIESSPQMTAWKSKGLECSTIDRYQGRDKPVVVLSFVRSNNRGKVGRLLGDFRRLNVAVSRAECKLIMIGSLSTLLEGSAPLRPALERLIATEKVVRVAG